MQKPCDTAYRDNATTGWSRIEMLNQLYRAALDATQKAADAVSANSAAAGQHCVQALALVNTIETGLDLNQGELPQRIQQLCHFVQASLLSGDVAKLESAVRVLRLLAEGFSGIQKEAIELEENGQIPPLQLSACDTFA